MAEAKKTTKKSTAKKTAAKKPAAKKRTAAQLRAEAEKKAIHAAKLDAENAKSRLEEVQETAVEYAKKGVDVPVGAALNLADRVSEVIEDWSDQASAEKKVKGYRADLTKTVKRAERRGITTRRKATTQARKQRKSLEKTVRQQRKSIEKTVKTTNKDVNKQIEARVNEVTKRANQVQADVTKVADEQGKKAQDLVNKVTEQLSALV
ncbi:MAG TPA: hypothetical protein PKA56_00585 [Solirubrobacterales bacterium]|nr:hypothetical protein [Solirubrobacterales bacterium]HMU25839.1 hypothetical protein [Solirubrobacterales bacterium]HMW45526.1 hypothetical protein [Solirubrobacterales bacterium]HMX70230.1 hypothetical protein [Solirubrobacterales bacterium]HMY24807.1 hypothetical protein [Solirubrobacterales bacterium]